MSTAPDDDGYAALVALGGRALDPDRLAAVAAAQRAMWPGLEAMRAVPLAFVDAIEPGHALGRLHRDDA